MQGTPSSHIENLGLYGPHYAQKIAEKGLSDLCQSGDSLSPMVQAESDSCADSADVKAQQFVGHGAARMSDEELDAAITRACVSCEAWFSQFKHLNDLTCLDMAYHFMGIARQLEHLRSGK